MSNRKVRFRRFVVECEYQPQYKPIYKTFIKNNSPELQIKNKKTIIDHKSYRYEPQKIM